MENTALRPETGMLLWHVWKRGHGVWKGRSALLCASIPAILLSLAAWTYLGNQQTLQFSPLSGPIVNPLMGWAPWATLAETGQPHTLVYADLTWRDFEPQPGVYAFEAFEKKQQFARWRAENQRVVFRFLIDTPGKEKHLDIPDWLYDEIQGKGDFYDTDYGKGFSPDYADPRLILRHWEVLHALGQRYGQDDFFAYIELGSLGHWGEWHVRYDAGIRRLPPAAVYNQYVQAYRDAFPNTLLLMRRPFAIASQLNLGLYNDMTGSPAQTENWLDWIANGGAYDQTGEPHALVPMPKAWRTAPIGGEQTNSLPLEDLYGSLLDSTLRLVEQSHMTFIGPNSPNAIEPGEELQDGINQVLKRLGYRIYIQQVQMPRRLFRERQIHLTLRFINYGAAPMYYNWPVQLVLFDDDGAVLKTYRPKMDLRQILPGAPYRISFTMPLGRMEEGIYTLGFAILDPHTGQPAVQLAMPNPRGDLIQEIGQFEVSSLFR
jgi:hypothetical protein